MKINNNLTKNLEIPKEIFPPQKNEKILLHACCAPCNLEPYRIIKSAGWDITIFYSNANIFPKFEFDRRFKELENWSINNNAKLFIDKYSSDSWIINVGSLKFGEYKSATRKIRCSKCYEYRLDRAAQFAIENNIKYLSSTLAVSPYQHNDILKEKLEFVCKNYNIKPIFMDFRPYYQNATKISKELGMYRQKYCGCEMSYKESMQQFIRTKNKKYLKELQEIPL